MLMSPNDAAEKDNLVQVKTQLESMWRSDNAQPRIGKGVEGSGLVKKKFEKGSTPGWSDDVYAAA